MSVFTGDVVVRTPAKHVVVYWESGGFKGRGDVQGDASQLALTAAAYEAQKPGDSVKGKANGQTNRRTVLVVVVVAVVALQPPPCTNVMQ